MVGGTDVKLGDEANDGHLAAAKAPGQSESRALTVADIRGRVDFAVVTIKPEEFAAALAQFGATTGHIVKGARDYVLTEISRSSGSPAIAAITRCPSQGNGVAQDVVRDVISDLDPQWILVVGIAGAAPSEEFGLGDVVLASQVLDFSVEAVKDDERTFAVEGRPIDTRVENFVATVDAHTGELGRWYELSAAPFVAPRVPLERPPIDPKAKGKVSGGPKWAKSVRTALQWQAGRAKQAPLVFPAPIAASDRLVKDPDLLKVWQIIARHVRAIEMESAGVHLAARGRGEHRKAYPAMSVRGISDIVGLKRDERWTQYACISAASFAYAFARLGYVTALGTLQLRDPASSARSSNAADGHFGSAASSTAERPIGVNGALSLAQVAHHLRMTPWLVRWFTQNAVCGNARLLAAGSPPIFEGAQVDAFNAALMGPWPSTEVPTEIVRELEREARGRCGLCGDANDRLELEHIRRKGIEQNFDCQHPANLLLMCPNCRSRYSSKLVPHVAVEHAKQLVQSRLMEAVDRDIVMERVLREEIRKSIQGEVGFADASVRMISLTTGRSVSAESQVKAVSELISTAQDLGSDQPLTAGFLLGTAFEGALDEDLDSFRYIDSLAKPLPTREEFDEEFDGYRMKDGHDPSTMLVAWAAASGAIYECGICAEICIDPDAFADALVEHWKSSHEELVADRLTRPDGEDEEEESEFDEAAVRQETYDAIINSGVEVGDIWEASGMCAYHAHVMAKDD